MFQMFQMFQMQLFRIHGSELERVTGRIEAVVSFLSGTGDKLPGTLLVEYHSFGKLRAFFGGWGELGDCDASE
jgi:hypothetical protein